MKLTVENVTKAPVQFDIGGLRRSNFVGGYDLIVTNTGGSQVWHWLGALEAWEAILSHVELEPGEQLRFEQEWPQADNRGRAVQPGTYLVRGVLRLATEEGQQVEPQTEAEELVVSP